MTFLNSASSAAALVLYLPLCRPCTQQCWKTESGPESGIYFKIFEKNIIFNEHPVDRDRDGKMEKGRAGEDTLTLSLLLQTTARVRIGRSLFALFRIHWYDNNKFKYQKRFLINGDVYLVLIICTMYTYYVNTYTKSCFLSIFAYEKDYISFLWPLFPCLLKGSIDRK